ncbi:MAG: hypothetical protein ACK4ST_09235, partial [Elioraea tepidiphila]
VQRIGDSYQPALEEAETTAEQEAIWEEATIAMVAAVATFDATGRVAEARIAVGACSPVPMRLDALEARLAGKRPDPALVEPTDLAPLAPIDDVRGTAAYRRDAALTLVRRALAGLAA